jgi:hypothetical protein
MRHFEISPMRILLKKLAALSKTLARLSTMPVTGWTPPSTFRIFNYLIGALAPSGGHPPEEWIAAGFAAASVAPAPAAFVRVCRKYFIDRCGAAKDN